MLQFFSRGIWYLRDLTMRVRVKLQRPLKSFSAYLPYIRGKSGLEIGGPSGVFREGDLLPIYEELASLDNCDFSRSTVWAKHSETFVFSPKKAPGKTLFLDGSDLVDVADSTYDVILSSHNLEHFANPVKALKEWQRVLKPTGALILVLPYYQNTFDHRRTPTNVDHMFMDFEQGTDEDDLTHLPEILLKHDLSMDLAAGSFENFHQRSLDNFSNRCLHQHVFDKANSRELLSRAGFEVLAADILLPIHICILARMA